MIRLSFNRQPISASETTIPSDLQSYAHRRAPGMIRWVFRAETDRSPACEFKKVRHDTDSNIMCIARDGCRHDGQAVRGLLFGLVRKYGQARRKKNVEKLPVSLTERF